MARVSSCGDLPETQEDLERALNEVNDPELGIGIVDLGLIYRAEWTRGGIEVDFTTTVHHRPRDCKQLMLCPVTGRPCEGDLGYLCPEYGCARKGGLSPRSEENF